jgi:hypothetical protein
MTVQKTLAKLGEIFRENVGFNTTYGYCNNGFHPSLAYQYWGMENEDPGKRKQQNSLNCLHVSRSAPQ